MSYDDKDFLARGFRVRHKYKQRRWGRHTSTCERCGVKRRKKPSGWEYQKPLTKNWSSSNPPCVKR